MSTRAFIGALAISLAVLPGNAEGCGDKFLVPGRGVRFPSRANREAAKVLLYAPSGSTLNETIARLSLDARLRAVGYRPSFVTSEAEFESLLRGGAWDVVVVDLANARDVQARLGGMHATVVLPVASDAAMTTLTHVARDYPHVLKSPRRDRAFVDALDRIVVAKTRSKTKTRDA
jgi:hypothetical protein